MLKSAPHGTGANKSGERSSQDRAPLKPSAASSVMVGFLPPQKISQSFLAIGVASRKVSGEYMSTAGTAPGTADSSLPFQRATGSLDLPSEPASADVRSGEAVTCGTPMATSGGANDSRMTQHAALPRSDHSRAESNTERGTAARREVVQHSAVATATLSTAHPAAQCNELSGGQIRQTLLGDNANQPGRHADPAYLHGRDHGRPSTPGRPSEIIDLTSPPSLQPILPPNSLGASRPSSHSLSSGSARSETQSAMEKRALLAKGEVSSAKAGEGPACTIKQAGKENDAHRANIGSQQDADYPAHNTSDTAKQVINNNGVELSSSLMLNPCSMILLTLFSFCLDHWPLGQSALLLDLLMPSNVRC